MIIAPPLKFAAIATDLSAPVLSPLAVEDFRETKNERKANHAGRCKNGWGPYLASQPESQAKQPARLQASNSVATILVLICFVRRD